MLAYKNGMIHVKIIEVFEERPLLQRKADRSSWWRLRQWDAEELLLRKHQEYLRRADGKEPLTAA